MDVVIMAGLNDVSDSQDVIVKNILRLYGDILEHNVHSTISVIPVMLPPSVAWLPGDGPPPDGFTNHLDKLLELNKAIRLFNSDHAKHSRAIISMEGEGVRTGTSKCAISGKNKRAHVWSAWEGFSADSPDTKQNLRELTAAKKVAAFKRILDFIKSEILKE